MRMDFYILQGLAAMMSVKPNFINGGFTC